jgi:hypothetical protein
MFMSPEAKDCLIVAFRSAKGALAGRFRSVKLAWIRHYFRGAKGDIGDRTRCVPETNTDWRALGLTALIALALLAGCGSGPTRAQVSGSASYGGKPIETGTIELLPVDGTKGPATGGAISGGRWEIARDKGPLVGGTYLVRITGTKKTGKTVAPPRGLPGQQPAEEVVNYIPAAYNTDSTLKIRVSERSADNQFQFDLKELP